MRIDLTVRLVLWVAVVGLAFAVGCDGSTASGPDAAIARGAHDQVTTCDPMWAVDRALPSACEFACASRPVHPTGTPAQCTDATRPCYTGPACAGADSPSDVPRDCDETFTTADGLHGCCVQRAISTQPPRYVPTFYECP